ncbi:MAG: hypothetical protein OEV15_02940, partial [Gallionella sp.]|nr:hypothetical protein [Gallionella sp.]
MPASALAPFFDEMRKELALTVPDFERWIGTMSTAASDDPQLTEAMESYGAQLERIGQTAELIGMAGLNAWCNSLNGILPGIVVMESEARTQACQQLLAWPALVDQYLQEPANFEASMALAEYLSAACFAQPFDEKASIGLVELLTT